MEAIMHLCASFMDLNPGPSVMFSAGRFFRNKTGCKTRFFRLSAHFRLWWLKQSMHDDKRHFRNWCEVVSLYPAVFESWFIPLHLMWMEQESSVFLINVCLTPCCLSDLWLSPPTGSSANCWSDLFSDTNAGLFIFCLTGSSETVHMFIKNIQSCNFCSLKCWWWKVTAAIKTCFMHHLQAWLCPCMVGLSLWEDNNITELMRLSPLVSVMSASLSVIYMI